MAIGLGCEKGATWHGNRGRFAAFCPLPATPGEDIDCAARCMDTTQSNYSSTSGGTAASWCAGIYWVHPRRQFTPLGSGVHLVGRDPAATIHLDDSQVSRRHATLERNAERLVLRDEGSRNSSRHNGRAVSSAALADNDVVRFGSWVGIVVSTPSDRFALDGFDAPAPGLVCGPRLRVLWQQLRIVAKEPIPVVIEGETGTGKEVFADGLHRASGRAGNWVAVNCSALPEALAESELFGHARGAFTGATQASSGYFVAADRGTLFLDEIAELPLGQQAKLLRVVEQSLVTPVGATVPRVVDVRLVCAAQKPLWQLVEEGRFRADLMARLSGVTLVLPPLRRRREEIPALFCQFLGIGGAADLQPGLVEALCCYDWPLNVRELVQAAKRAKLLLAQGLAMTAERVSELLVQRPTVPPSPALAPGTVASELDFAQVLGTRTAAWFQRHQADLGRLREAMDRSGQNISRAASAVGISRQQAQRLLDAAARLEAVRRSGEPGGARENG